MPLVRLLKKLDLADKEAAVYLTCLELGSAPASQIARKADLLRPTTYLILESLIKKGLITRYRQGKKTMFMAEPPRQLLHLIDNQEKELQVRRKELEEALPNLQAIMAGAEDRPAIHYYEGVDGLRAIRQEMLRYSTEKDTWYNMVPVDYLVSVFGENDYVYSRYLKAKGVQSYSIITTRSEKLKEYLMTQAKWHFANRKFVSPEIYSSTSGLTICRDRLAIATYTGQIGGMVIESESIANLARSFFIMLWNSLEG